MSDKTSLTPQDVADILNIAKNTVYELIKRGELNGYRVGRKVRVDMKDVEDYKNKTKKIKSTSTAPLKQIPQTRQAQPASNFENINDDAKISSSFIICGQDIMLDILSTNVQQYINGIHTYRSYTGSYSGLYALYNGKVDVASVHLWDGDSDTYNIPYVRRMLPGTPAVIIHLACRMQGFYVVKGNPKGIKDWIDFKRNDITFINREKGCGTRVLLDEHLRMMKYSGQFIHGYSRECTSHLVAASTIARGGADFAMGNEKTVSQVQGIDFIPLQKERYELVMKKDDIEKPQFQTLMDIIRSDNFRLELSSLGCYDLSETGRITAET